MPELPEVEHFRQILLPLVVSKATSAKKGSNKRLSVLIECPPPLPTKRFPSQDVIDLINQGCYVMKDVLRKGKVLCVILEKQNYDASSARKKRAVPSANPAKEGTEDNGTIPITGKEPTLYLSLHMGMTGRISSPNHVPGLESLSKNDAYPPPHTHLTFRSNGEEASFSDPRRFGSVLVDVGGEDEVVYADAIPTFQDIAPDALEASTVFCATKKPPKGSDAVMQQQPTIVEQLMNRKKGIKGLLLDQRAVVSGVGNWVADEVLYRSCIHPDQSYLNMIESQKLVEEIHYVLSTAVACLNNRGDFPDEWLFHRRWRNGGGGGDAKDFIGKTITFVQSGGRSTAIVAALQKNKARKSPSHAEKATRATSKKSKGESKHVDVPSPKPKSVAKTSTSKTSNTQGRKRKRVEEALPKPKIQPTRRSERAGVSLI